MQVSEDTALTIRTLNEVIANNDSWIVKSAAILGGAFIAFWALAEQTNRMTGFFAGLLAIAAVVFLICYLIIIWRTMVENGELRSRRSKLLDLPVGRGADMTVEGLHNQFSFALLGREPQLVAHAPPKANVPATMPVPADTPSTETPPR